MRGWIRDSTIDEETELDLPVMPGFELVRRRDGLMLQPKSGYHAAMKTVPTVTVVKANQNKPLEGLPRDDDEVQIGDDPSALQQFMSDYLRRLFPSLATIDIDYNVVDFDTSQDELMIVAQEARYNSLKMATQAERLREEYKRFVITRQMLVWIWEQNLLRSGTKLSPAILTALVRLVETGVSSTDKAAKLAQIQQVLSFMSTNDLLRPNTVIPLHLLPELYMAAPVWYFVPTENHFAARHGSLWGNDDPQVGPDIKFFCDVVPDSQNWIDLFLLFNRRLRLISLYSGEEIPPNIMELLPKAVEVFDYVVIMTPYHDVAGREWEDPAWQRAIDPYVVGFKKGLPFFFLLGRYSQSGVFPLLSELIADTIEYLRNVGDRLKVFNGTNHGGKQNSYAYWFVRNELHERSTNSSLLGTILKKQVEDMLAAFENGQLFDWLRNTNALP